MTNQTKTYRTKNDDRTRRSWKPWLARMQKSHGKVKKMLECVEQLRRWTTKRLHTCILSIFPWTKSAAPRNPPRRKTSTASRCLALMRSQEQDRHASLPFRSSIVRMTQMVVQWVIQAQWRPLLIKGKLIQLWRVRVGVELSCRGRRVFHGSEKKRTGNEVVSEMAKIFHAPPCNSSCQWCLHFRSVRSAWGSIQDIAMHASDGVCVPVRQPMKTSDTRDRAKAEPHHQFHYVGHLGICPTELTVILFRWTCPASWIHESVKIQTNTSTDPERSRFWFIRLTTQLSS